MATTAVMTGSQGSQAELEDEVRQADEDFASGDFIDVTIEELDRCTAAGDWPWRCASCE